MALIQVNAHFSAPAYQTSQECCFHDTFAFQIKTFGFYRLFRDRLFFERGGLLERRSAEKAPKSTNRHGQNRPNVVQNRAKIARNHSSEPLATRSERSKRSFDRLHTLPAAMLARSRRLEALLEAILARLRRLSARARSRGFARARSTFG